MAIIPGSEQEGANSRRRHNSAKRLSANSLRVAVLDDEPLIRDLLREILTAMGHGVTCFDRACEALEATRSRFFDVILSDIKMRGMSGVEFFERLQTADPAQAGRVLFITGDMLAPATQLFLERADCLCLRKPFRQVELCATIEELLQRCQCPDESAFQSKAA